MGNNKMRLEIKYRNSLEVKVVTCIFLMLLFFPFMNLLSEILKGDSWTNITKQVGDISTVGALIIAGVFFRGRNNRKMTYVVAGLFFGYTYLYMTVANLLLGYPYIGVWLDSVFGLIIIFGLLYLSYIECYIYKSLGQRGFFPKLMLEKLRKHGSTNFYFSVVFIYCVSTFVDLVILSLGLTGYGIANGLPFEGSFYAHMVENGHFIYFDNHKLYIYDIRELFQMLINIIFSFVIIGHVIRDQIVPDEIGFNGTSLREYNN